MEKKLTWKTDLNFHTIEYFWIFLLYYLFFNKNLKPKILLFFFKFQIFLNLSHIWNLSPFDPVFWFLSFWRVWLICHFSKTFTQWIQSHIGKRDFLRIWILQVIKFLIRFVHGIFRKKWAFLPQWLYLPKILHQRKFGIKKFKIWNVYFTV